MTECDTDTPMEHVVLQEDAVSWFTHAISFT